MTRLEALRALLEEVEAGTASGQFGPIMGEYWGGDEQIDAMRAYNGSLDAAIALHKAVSPGVPWRLDSGNRAEILLAGLDDFGFLAVLKSFGVTNNHSPARAWLIAILKVLITVETKG